MMNLANFDKWTPRKLSNLRLWLNAEDSSSLKDASNGEISNGENVSKWYCSQFGYEFNDQSTSTKQPIWNSSGFGTKSKPYVQFDGTSDILRCVNSTLLSNLTSDSVGSVIIIGSNSNNSTTSTAAVFLGSFDELTSLQNGILFYSQGISQIFYATLYNNQSGVVSSIRQTQGVTSGANDEVYYLFTSNNSAYSIRTKATVSVPVTYTNKLTQSGTDDGDWFDNVPNRDSLTIGAYKHSSEVWTFCRIAEIIVTGTNLSGTTDLDYLDSYIQRKYGNLIQR